MAKPMIFLLYLQMQSKDLTSCFRIWGENGENWIPKWRTYSLSKKLVSWLHRTQNGGFSIMPVGVFGTVCWDIAHPHDRTSGTKYLNDSTRHHGVYCDQWPNWCYPICPCGLPIQGDLLAAWRHAYNSICLSDIVAQRRAMKQNWRKFCTEITGARVYLLT